MRNGINIPTLEETTSSDEATTSNSEVDTAARAAHRELIEEEAKWVAFDTMTTYAELLMKEVRGEVPESAPQFFEAIRPLYEDVTMKDMAWIIEITSHQHKMAKGQISLEEFQAFTKTVPSDVMEAYEEIQEKQEDFAMDLL